MLSNDEISDIAMQSGAYDEQLSAFARAIEAAVFTMANVLADSRARRIATLESTLRVALEALEYHQEQTRPITSTTEAIKQIEEILK